MTGTSPPGPLRCGSTTCSVNAVAQAASNALPPRSRMPIPTAVAIQWVEVTTPKVPSISGRVVNGLGLTKFILKFRGWRRDGGLDHSSRGRPTAPDRHQPCAPSGGLFAVRELERFGKAHALAREGI